MAISPPPIIPPGYLTFWMTYDTLIVARQVTGFQAFLNRMRRRIPYSTVGTVIAHQRGHFDACCLTPSLIEQPFTDIQAACDFIVSKQR